MRRLRSNFGRQVLYLRAISVIGDQWSRAGRTEIHPLVGGSGRPQREWTQRRFASGRFDKTEKVPEKFKFGAALPVSTDLKKRVPLGAPQERRFAMPGTGKLQPVNPQWLPKEAGALSPEVQALTRKKPKRQADTLGSVMLENKRGVKMSEDTAERVLDSYALSRWYAFLWRFFRRFNMKVLQSYRRVANVLMVTCLFSFIGAMLVMSYNERQVYLLLDPDERRDYRHVILGMKASEVFKIQEEVMAKEDPLGTLPLRQQVKLLVKRLRELGLHKVDWELENRNRTSGAHRASDRTTEVTKYFDPVHLIYWTAVYFGALCNGGASIFDDPEFTGGPSKRRDQYRLE